MRNYLLAILYDLEGCERARLRDCPAGDRSDAETERAAEESNRCKPGRLGGLKGVKARHCEEGRKGPVEG